MHAFTRLIKEDMRPALGVTEPGAIAFAVSKAKSYTEGEVEEVLVLLNSGMYKNAFTCGIPNSNEVGNVFSAALGVVAGIPEKGLESLENVVLSSVWYSVFSPAETVSNTCTSPAPSILLRICANC